AWRRGASFGRPASPRLLVPSSRSPRPSRRAGPRRWRRCAMTELTLGLNPPTAPAAPTTAPRRFTLSARVGLVLSVVIGGLVELWAHKLRSILTLTLLMLGVFALVVMTSVLDVVLD